MDVFEQLLKEVDDAAKAAKLKKINAGLPAKAGEAIQRIFWEPSAIVAIFQSTVCLNCGAVHIHPVSGQLLVRYRNAKKADEIWESATPAPLIPKGLPEAVRYITGEAEVCHECFGMSCATCIEGD